MDDYSTDDLGDWNSDYSTYAPGASTDSSGDTGSTNVANTWGSIISSLGQTASSLTLASQGISLNPKTGMYYNSITGQYYNPTTGKYTSGLASNATLWIALIVIAVVAYFFFKR
jgi:hypothetical protein